MRLGGLDGNVQAQGVVNTDGLFEYIEVPKAVHPAFEKAAVKGMLAARMTPGGFRSTVECSGLTFPSDFIR